MQVDMRTAMAVLVYVSFGIAGQLVLSHAMKQMSPQEGSLVSETAGLFRYIGTTPAVWLGIALLSVNFCMLLTLLRSVEVSVIVPASAISYLLLALLAKLLLHEQVSTGRWLGVLLISAGVALVMCCSPSRRTGSAQERREAVPLLEMQSARPISLSSSGWYATRRGT